MDSNTIIEFETNGTYRLGIITGEIGKKKLLVLAETGDEMRPTHKDVSFQFADIKPKGGLDNDAMRETLNELRSEISAYVDDVDLEMLWEVARESDNPLAAKELAELMFATDTSVATLAIIIALRADNVYFKSKRDTYEARAPDLVESLLEQRAARLKKEARRQLVIDALGACRNASDETKRQEILDNAYHTVQGFGDYLTQLQDYASLGEDYDRIAQVEELLEDIQQALKLKLKGRGPVQAFQLLVTLGIWHEHENLWLYRYKIPAQHDSTVSALATQYATQVSMPQFWQNDAARRDLTDLYCVTIDDESTLDIDDAISCVPHIDGSFEVGIHIADPSAMVPINCPVDSAAQRLGTSLYLPTGIISMFPQCLSENSMSLVEGQLRPAISTIVRFDESLNIIDYQLFPSVIKVSAKASYDEADQLLHTESKGRLANFLHTLSYITDELMNRRMDQGAMSIDIPEVKFKVCLNGSAPNITRYSVNQESLSRLLISELMILTNYLTAKFCADHAIPTLYRGQSAPDSELYDDTVMQVPEGVARSFAMVRKMKRSDYTTFPNPHFGLGLDYYVQASSPIRRYGDLICQRQLKAFLAEEELPYDDDKLIELLAVVDNTCRDASRVERETFRYWSIYYLAQHKDIAHDAVVVEHKDNTGTRVGVFLESCALKVNCNLPKPLPPGTPIKVVVERANPRRDILVLRQA